MRHWLPRISPTDFLLLKCHNRLLILHVCHTLLRVGATLAAVFFAGGLTMSFRLIHANYDKKTRRAYVELRKDDPDGDEMIIAAIFSYRRTSIITKRALEQDLATKARHLMKSAAVGLDSPP